MNVLVVDVGGSSVKILATGQDEARKFSSGPKMTAEQMVAGVKALTGDWDYDVVSIGYGGKLLFLGLGTGLGSAMVVDGRILPMELAHLPYKNGSFEEPMRSLADFGCGRKVSSHEASVTSTSSHRSSTKRRQACKSE